MKYKIIALCSQMRHGKNMASDYLHSHLKNDGWYDWSFAKKVKEIFCISFGVDLKFIERWKTIDQPPPGWTKTVREGLIAIGDGLRQINPNIWINHYFENVPGNSIANDARYPNEWASIRSRGGINVLLIRSNFINDLQNDSEQLIKPWLEKYKNYKDGPIQEENIPFDFILINNGSINDLYHKIDSLLIPYLKEKGLI